MKREGALISMTQVVEALCNCVLCQVSTLSLVLYHPPVRSDSNCLHIGPEFKNDKLDPSLPPMSHPSSRPAVSEGDLHFKLTCLDGSDIAFWASTEDEHIGLLR